MTAVRPRMVGYDHHKPRLTGHLMLGTAYALAAFAGRHRRTVLRYCRPIACDVTSHAELFNIDTDLAVLKAVPRREKADGTATRRYSQVLDLTS